MDRRSCRGEAERNRLGSIDSQLLAYMQEAGRKVEGDLVLRRSMV
jgi:hypothetical protein